MNNEQRVSSHTTPRKDWFSSFSKGINDQVVLGDSSTQDTVGKVNIPIQFNSGFSSVIKNALLIPNLARNLLSVGAIIDQDMLVEFYNDRCFIKDLK
ncbi:hypothetical protein O6H91_06G089200 [Diphasiastrum complanatum]|uniref:Uncharacterized protein n=1 Tax=Diphasiastrum complanatum TaxID=34168 RepID=A0ACC2DGJ7_DIPCM|nr:hypothetical protein O6H91_Y201600 [Diphasiastrum complanatum]KAJ7553235.1 hypothetical protein O6H91_06G089200 [Diphasiastrum complanatum]